MNSEEIERARVTLDAGGRRIQMIVVWATLLVAAAAFVVGVPALVWAGTAAGLGPVAWLVPLVVDLGLTVAGLAAAVRHSQVRRSGLETSMMLGLVGLSMAVQALHAIELAAPVVAAVVVAAAPLTVLAATHATFRAVLAEPAGRGRKKAASRPTAPAGRPAAKPAVAPVAGAGSPGTTGRPGLVAVDRPAAAVAATPAEMTLEEAVAEALAGRMSQRQAATAAAVSRHAIAAAVSAASTAESAA